MTQRRGHLLHVSQNSCSSAKYITCSFIAYHLSSYLSFRSVFSKLCLILCSVIPMLDTANYVSHLENKILRGFPVMIVERRKRANFLSHYGYSQWPMLGTPIHFLLPPLSEPASYGPHMAVGTWRSWVFRGLNNYPLSFEWHPLSQCHNITFTGFSFASQVLCSLGVRTVLFPTVTNSRLTSVFMSVFSLNLFTNYSC